MTLSPMKDKNENKGETANPEHVRKAQLQILSMIEDAYKPRDQRDLAEWIVSAMPSDTVAGLAEDWDQWNEDAPAS